MTAFGGGQLPTWFRSRDRLAKEVSAISGRRISDRTLRRISTVVAFGVSELNRAMDAGVISIAAAAELARLPDEMQRHTLELNPRAIRYIVRQIRSDRGMQS
jgi:hypothetical protein